MKLGCALLMLMLAWPACSAPNERNLPPGWVKLTTPITVADVFLDTSVIGVLTKPEKLRFAGVFTFFNEPSQIQGRMAAAFIKVSAYDCTKLETTIIKSAFLGPNGDEITGLKKQPQTAVKVNQNDKNSRFAELTAVCALPSTKFKIVDNPNGADKLRRLFEDDPGRPGPPTHNAKDLT